MVIVWRYRHKKKALWKKLERKYGEAVREIYEWEDYEGPDGSKEHDETLDLDGDDEEHDGDEDEL